MGSGQFLAKVADSKGAETTFLVVNEEEYEPSFEDVRRFSTFFHGTNLPIRVRQHAKNVSFIIGPLLRQTWKKLHVESKVRKREDVLHTLHDDVAQ